MVPTEPFSIFEYDFYTRNSGLHFGLFDPNLRRFFLNASYTTSPTLWQNFQTMKLGSWNTIPSGESSRVKDSPTKRICLEKRYLSSAERAKKVFMTALIVSCFEKTCSTDSGCFASSDHLVVAVVISR